ncbi:MAG: Bax inhibitor-1/YccA family protein [Gammaproteobacteria bacterium]|nr:Bax inhibitor-1/YccA family protein [Gammaproteobacteria bacterium]
MSQPRMISATVPTLAMNRVLRNTYALLALTLLFSAFTAGLSMVFNWPYPGLILTLVGYFGLLFLTSRFRDSGWGLLCVFALTGFMGITLGPILNYYLVAVHNGSQLVATALGMTGGIFLLLSGYVLTTRRNFSFMGGMLMVGILVAFLSALGLVVASMFGMEVSGAMLGISALVVLLMCGLILYQTSEIIHGGETNYIMATVTLYVALYNLFTSLLHLLAAFGGDD